MAIDPIFEKVFKRLYGKPCWGVRNTYCTALAFAFGEPHLQVREPAITKPSSSRRVREALARRDVFVCGEWRLLIWQCDWEIYQKGKRVGSNRSRKTNLQRIASGLDGQKLVGFSINKSGTKCVFEFDLGGAVKTSCSDPDGDQWELYDHARNAFLILGGKKSFCYKSFSPKRPKRWSDAGSWKPVHRK